MRRTEFTRLLSFAGWSKMFQNLPDIGRILWTAKTCVLLVVALAYSGRATAQCTIVCNDDAQVSLPGLADNCEGLITHDMVLRSPNSACPGSKTVSLFDQNGNILPQQPYGIGHTGSIVGRQYIGQKLTVRIFDNTTGNYCWGGIRIEDKLGPQFSECQDSVTWCLVDPVPQPNGTFPRPVVDDCSGAANVQLVHSDSIINGTCTDTFSKIIVRHWVATDPHGNQSDCVQRITLNKVSLADSLVRPQCPSNVILECDNTNPPSTHPDSTGYPFIVLDSIRYDIKPGAGFACELAANYKDEIFDLCGGGKKILRTWTIYDWCLPTGPGQNPFTCIQVIKVEDKTPPSIKCPNDFTVGSNSWSCGANVTLPPALVSDACSNFTVTTLTPIGAINRNGGLIRNVPVGVHTITYIATDACGNSISCTTTLTVIDNTPPVAVCDEHTVVSLTSDGTATIFAPSFDDGSNDNCEIDSFKVRRMDDNCQPINQFDDFETFSCCDIGDTVQVIFRVFDVAGNFNDCMVSVWVQDKLPPVVTCPPDKIANCSADLSDLSIFGNATATDNCGNVTIDVSVNRNLDQCGVGVIRRTFIATDLGGRTDTCVQRIDVINDDPFNGDDIEWPRDYTTNQCIASTHPDSLPCRPINYCRPKLRSNACGHLAVTYTDQLLPIAMPACFKILRKWIVIDWCQYDPNSTSSAGYWQHTQVVKVEDTTPPLINCSTDTIRQNSLNALCDPVQVDIPPFTAIDCNPNLVFSIKIDFFNDGIYDETRNGNDASGLYPNGTHRIQVRADDGCGNFSICERIVKVSETKKPTAICLNGVSATLMPDGFGGGMVDLTPEMFNNGSFDNCTPRHQLKLKLTPSRFTCDERGLNLVRMAVTDLSGNTDFCETFVDIQDNMGVCDTTGSNLRLAGFVKDESGTAMPGVNIDLNGDNNTVLNTFTTSNDGTFAFTDLQQGYDYTVAPRYDINTSAGVSTFDLVLITKHILNVNQLDSPYKIIAADANKSGNVSTLDLVVLRKLILRVSSELPNNSSWRFIDKDFIFPDPADPFSVVFPEVKNFNNISSSNLAVNFVAIKVGDVNGSASTNLHGGVDNRSSRNKLVLQTDEAAFDKGAYVEVPFYAEDFTGIVGFQFTIEFDENTLELTDLKTGGLERLDEQNFGLMKVDEGFITASWDNTKTTLNGKTGALFTLIFRAKNDGQISDVLNISSQLTEAEAYAADELNSNDLEIRNVQLKFSNGKVAGAGFELYQNAPNPFAKSTVIGFNLPEADFATLSIFDLSGKVLKTITGNFATGYNVIEVNNGDLATGGVLYYRLETSNHTATRKMVVVK